MKYIQLYGKQALGKKMVIDDKDYASVSIYHWNVSNWGYPYTTVNGKLMPIGRFLLFPPTKMEVDHINRNPLDNRRSNLRICTRQENQFNTSVHKNSKTGIKGVYWHKHGKRWAAQIRLDRKQFVRYFRTIEEATVGYNKLVDEYAPEFGLYNAVRGK